MYQKVGVTRMTLPMLLIHQRIVKDTMTFGKEQEGLPSGTEIRDHINVDRRRNLGQELGFKYRQVAQISESP